MSKHIQIIYMHVHKRLKKNKPCLSVSRLSVLLQGNQMTLVFMEREYSSPEEPHLGIVHMVEVNSPSWVSVWVCLTAQPKQTGQPHV